MFLERKAVSDLDKIIKDISIINIINIKGELLLFFPSNNVWLWKLDIKKTSLWKKTKGRQILIKLCIWRLRALWTSIHPGYLLNHVSPIMSAHHKRSGRVGFQQLTTIISWDSRDGPSLLRYLLLWNIIIPGIWMDQVLPAIKNALETWFFLRVLDWDVRQM